MIENIEIVPRKTPLFASLTENEIKALAIRVSKRHAQRGELLFGEGDPCKGLYLVVSGKIRIFKVSAEGREQVLAIEGRGSSFAELPVFDGGSYPAGASASEDAELLFISRKDFQNFCREHPDVALKVIAVVGTRLRRLLTLRQQFPELQPRIARRQPHRPVFRRRTQCHSSHPNVGEELTSFECMLEVIDEKLVQAGLRGSKRGSAI